MDSRSRQRERTREETRLAALAFAELYGRSWTAQEKAEYVATMAKQRRENGARKRTAKGSPTPKKRKTRRSLSINGLVYQRLLAYCERAGVAISAMVQALIVAELDRLGAPIETVLRPHLPRRPHVHEASPVSGVVIL